MTLGIDDTVLRYFKLYSRKDQRRVSSQPANEAERAINVSGASASHSLEPKLCKMLKRETTLQVQHNLDMLIKNELSPELINYLRDLSRKCIHQHLERR